MPYADKAVAKKYWKDRYERKRPELQKMGRDYYANVVAPKKRAAGIFGVCEICKESGRVYRDHNHQTQQLRGLLCATCNSAIGLLHESIFNLTSAIHYLERWR